MPWRDAIDLIDQLRLETGSHLFASIGGWGWVASLGDVAQMQHLQAYLAAHTDKGTDVPQIPMPWDEPAAAIADEPLTEERRAELRAQLDAQSAFRTT